MAEAKSFVGHREILLDLFMKHVTPKPERKFEFEPSSHRLSNPWGDSDLDTDGDHPPAKETECVSVEFVFLERLRQNWARKNRKRPIVSGSETPQPESKKVSLGSPPPPSVSRDQNIPKTEEAKSDSVSSEKRKKISWP